MHDEFDVDVSLPLPADWGGSIRSAVLNIVVLVRIATLAAREFLIKEGDVVLAQYLDDIRDMYYVFDVSDDRAERKTFSCEECTRGVRSLLACLMDAADSERLVSSLL